MKRKKLINKKAITFIKAIPSQYSNMNLWWKYKKSRKGNFFKKPRPEGFTDYNQFIEVADFLEMNPNLILGAENKLYEIPKVLMHLCDGSTHSKHFSTYGEADDFATKLTREMEVIEWKS